MTTEDEGGCEGMLRLKSSVHVSGRNRSRALRAGISIGVFEEGNAIVVGEVVRGRIANEAKGETKGRKPA